jgi:autotransporter-associated beta strand protein
MIRKWIFCVASANIALATNATWDVNANGNWDVDGNWTPATFPNSIDSTANFLNIISASRTITLGQDITIGTIIFDDNNNYTISGANNLIFDVSSGDASLSIQNSNGNGAHRINSDIILNRNLDAASNSISTFRLVGNISGAGGLSWTGSNTGDLLVTGVNTYTGQTNINDGTFTYGTDGCIPTTSLVTIGTGSSSNAPTLDLTVNVTAPLVIDVLSDGTLIQENNKTVQLLSLGGAGQVNLSIGNSNANLFEINGVMGDTFSGSMSGGLANASTNPTANNRVYKDGTSIQVFSGDSNYTSRTFIANGAINAQNDNALGVAGSSSAVYVRNTGTSGSLYLQNNISLPKNVFINGPGFLSSGAIQNVSGDNEISGPVQVGWSGGPETASDGTIQVTAGSLNLSGILSGSNNITIAGSGDLIYSGALANTLSGTTTVNGGTLQLDKTAGVTALVFDAQINSGGEIQLLSPDQIIDSANITINGGTFDLNGNEETINTLFFNSGSMTQGGAVLTLASPTTALSMRNTSITGDLLLSGGGGVIFDNAAGGTATISGNIDLGGSNTTFNISNDLALIQMQISGEISDGGLIKQGSGTLSLLGANTYGGGTTISAGTLQGNATSLQGNITDNANLVFDQPSTGTYSGMITGLGTFEKKGNGTLIISNTNSVAGAATVSQGTLLVNGTLGGGGSLVVNPGATLGGSGTIQRNANISGTLSPGNSIDTIHFVGTQTLESGSTLAIELNSTTADLVDVTGTASIQPNATLSLFPESTSYPASFTNTYTIIQTTDGVSGTFSSIQHSLPLFNPQVVYTVDDVLLNVSFLPIFNLFPNGKAGQVAHCLDEMSSADSETVINQLRFLTSTSEIDDALLQMQPSPFTSLTVAEQNNIYYFQKTLNNRLEDKVRRFEYMDQLTLWASPLIGHTFQNNQYREPGYRTTTPGIMIGLDGSNFGGALGYSYTNFIWKKGRGDARIQNSNASFYGRWGNDAAYLLGSLMGSYTAFSSERKIAFGSFKRQASGRHFGYTGSADIKGGLRFSPSSLNISPYFELSYSYLHETKIKEHGAKSLNLIIQHKNSQLLTSEIGLEISRFFSNSSIFFKGSAQYEKRFTGKEEKGTFSCQCCSLDVNGLYPNRLLGAFALGINTISDEMKFISLFYEGRCNSHFFDQSLYLQISF